MKSTFVTLFIGIRLKGSYENTLGIVAKPLSKKTDKVLNFNLLKCNYCNVELQWYHFVLFKIIFLSGFMVFDAKVNMYVVFDL